MGKRRAREVLSNQLGWLNIQIAEAAQFFIAECAADNCEGVGRTRFVELIREREIAKAALLEIIQTDEWQPEDKIHGC